MSKIVRIHNNVVIRYITTYWREIFIQLDNEWNLGNPEENIRRSSIRLSHVLDLSDGIWRKPLVVIEFVDDVIPPTFPDRLKLAEAIANDIDKFWQDPKGWIDFYEETHKIIVLSPKIDFSRNVSWHISTNHQI